MDTERDSFSPEEPEYLTQAPQIQWFPGHMAKTRRVMKESLGLVDIVVELRDARIPKSSRNPEIEKIVGDKPRLVVFNKADMADASATRQWQDYYKQHGVSTLALDCKTGKGLNQLLPAVRETLHDLLERRAQRGMASRPIRMMIVGVPNVGKSSLINRLAGGKRAKVEDRPGVTRGKQWVRLDNGIELLDMPGVLWPKFEDRQVGERLAYTGAVKDDVYDIEWAAMRFLAFLREKYPQLLLQRYKVTPQETEGLEPFDLLELVGRKRGMMVSGGQVNTERAAITVLDEFRSGKIGRITLERPARLAPEAESEAKTPDSQEE